MGVCVPKQNYCYESTNGVKGFIPDFTAGTEICVLPEFNEYRARNILGGELFRSVNGGTSANNISITCSFKYWNGSTWVDTTESTYAAARDALYTTPTINNTTFFIQVTLTVDDGINTPDIYTSCQYQVYYAGAGSPLTGAWEWKRNAVHDESYLPSLPSSYPDNVDYTVGFRNQLVSSTIATLPDIDIQTIGIGSPDGWDSSIYDPDHIASFTNSNLTGGSGPPDLPTSAIRTGPAISMIYIRNSDATVDGSILTIDTVKVWDSYVGTGAWVSRTGSPTSDGNRCIDNSDPLNPVYSDGSPQLPITC